MCFDNELNLAVGMNSLVQNLSLSLSTQPGPWHYELDVSGLIVSPQNSNAEVLTSSISEYDYMWRKGL